MIELIYHYSVLAIGTLVLFMNFTSENVFIELTFKAIFKIVSLFIIGYSMVRIFKYYGIIT